MDLPAAISRYAARLHAAAGSEHHVASPLGAWLLVALVAGAPSSPGQRAEMTDVLGIAPEPARDAARRLLAHPPVALDVAAAAWHGVESEGLRQWLGSLGSDVATGAIPSPHEADEWASRHTHHLIDRFPIDVGADTLLVLASAVATTVTWIVPFEAIPSTTLTRPAADGFNQVATVLHSPTEQAEAFFVDSADGLLAVHVMPATDRNLLVASVLGPPTLPARTVLEHAHKIAMSVGQHPRSIPDRRSLFDLPLGPSPVGAIAERTASTRGPDEDYDVVLPAWSATSRHALLPMPGLGFDTATEILRPLVPGARSVDAQQSAMARYTRTGFEAAAVTGVQMLASAVVARTRRIRTARIEFTRPFAAVAVAPRQPWAGLPLFSAWITRADEASDA